MRVSEEEKKESRGCDAIRCGVMRLDYVCE
jgi:hypothetical protein